MVNLPIILVFVIFQFISITAKKKKLFIDTLEITKRRSETFSLCLGSMKEEYKMYQARGYDQVQSKKSMNKSATVRAMEPETKTYAKSISDINQMDQIIGEFYSADENRVSILTDGGNGVLTSAEFKEAIEFIKK